MQAGFPGGNRGGLVLRSVVAGSDRVPPPPRVAAPRYSQAPGSVTTSGAASCGRDAARPYRGHSARIRPRANAHGHVDDAAVAHDGDLGLAAGRQGADGLEQVGG